MPNPKPLLHTILICLFLIHGLPGVQYGQEKRYANGLYFERFSFNEGLPSQSTYCVVSGQEGYLWMGSNLGVVRYDGYTFQPYPFSEGSLPITHGDINFLDEDSGGNLWFTVVSREEVFRFDPDSGTYQHFSGVGGEKLLKGPVTALVAVAENELWIGSADAGLYHLRLTEDVSGGRQQLQSKHFLSASGTERAPSSGPLSDAIRALLLHPSGDLWIATDEGVSRIVAGQELEGSASFEHFHPHASPASHLEEAAALALGASGGVWIAGRKTGPQGGLVNVLEYFDYSSGDFLTLTNDIPGEAPVSSLLESINGHLYMGVWGEGLYLVRHARNALAHKRAVVRAYQFEPPAGWANNRILDMVQGRFENIWIATYMTGLYKLNPYANQFAHYRPSPLPEGQNAYFTTAIEGPGGKVWIGSSSSGVYCYDRTRNTFKQYLPEQGNPYSLASRMALSVFVDKDSNVWVGTTAGPNRYEPETGRFIRYPEPKGFILSMYQDDLGYRWFGTIHGGLTLLDSSGQFIAQYRYREEDPHGLSGAGAWQVYKDRNGDIYVPTTHGLNRVVRRGSLRMDSLRFERVETPYSFVNWMHQDRSGRYWLSYLSHGVCQWDSPGDLCREHNLQSSTANVILEDAQGRLWLSSGVGIVCFDPEMETVHRYDNSYGIPFAGLGRFGGKNARGEITLGAGSLGFTVFHPDSIRINPTAPVVMITAVSVSGSSRDSSLAPSLPGNGGLGLSYQNNSLAFEYKALHFGRPEKNRYAYRLHGLEEEWIDAGQSRVARYSKLPPGRYAFQVKAVSADGVWSETEASVLIRISPPWWRSGWAYGFYAILLISAMAGYNRFQRKRRRLEARLALEQQKAVQLEQMDAFKSRFFTNITHEFRTPLTIILGMADQIRLQPHKLLDEGLRMITRNGKALLRLVNQMLDLARAESGTLKVRNIQADILPFLKYLAESFHSYAESRRIALSFHSKQQELVMDYDPDKIEKICSNLISNAIKFTPRGGNVKCEIGRRKAETEPTSHFRFPTPDLLAITVRDTGMGIAEERLPYVFERFYEAPPGPSEGGAGAGIGLALAKELAELLGGAITVESELGKGSAFTVTLPITRQAAVADAQPWRSDEGTAREKSMAPVQAKAKPASTVSTQAQHPLLLIVEDNPDVRAYLKTLLEGRYKIRTAPDGEAGVEKALAIVPDLVISDVMMPNQDGFELCRILKNDRRTSHIPIILLTARSDLDSRLAGLRRGADAYLVKPFNHQELEVQLQKALKLRKSLLEKYSGWPSALLTKEEPPSLDAQFLQQAREIIGQNLENPDFDVTELYHVLGVSRTQCFRKCKALTGKAPAEFIRYYRLEYARALLADSASNISQVAYAAGFRDPAYFARAFQREYGTSPSMFRSEMNPQK